MGLNSFSRKERLRKNSAIKTVLDNGICYKSQSINVYILRQPGADVNKAAFICKKNLHQKKSVIRNRVRRILREAYRKTSHILPNGHDIVVIGTKMSQDTCSLGIEKEIIDVFKKYYKK